MGDDDEDTDDGDDEGNDEGEDAEDTDDAEDGEEEGNDEDDDDTDENAEDDKCQWEDWSEWTCTCRRDLFGRCSVGMHTRTRNSDNKLFDLSACCGLLCSGRQIETRPCTEEDCDEDHDHDEDAHGSDEDAEESDEESDGGDEESDDGNEDDDCAWEDWSEWTGACRTLFGRCIGSQTRTRTSDNKLFNPGCCGFLCSGRQTETRTCEEADCEAAEAPATCQWGDWGEWQGTCRTIFGRKFGSQKRTRRAANNLQNGLCCGILCSGAETETRGC